MKPDVEVYKNQKRLAEAVAADFHRAVNQAADEGKDFHIALSGGQTPRVLYERLARAPYKDSVPWGNVHLFWGDERCVPPDHPDSNYGMTRQSLLDHISIPESNIHRIHGEADPELEAIRYAQEIQNCLPKGSNGTPRFDWILLGLGMDGHTASLFPRTSALVENKQLATAVFVSILETWRVTLTLPLINSAKEVLFLVSGQNKADTVKRVFAAEHPTNDLPASMVHPKTGRLRWVLDEDAAYLINLS